MTSNLGDLPSFERPPVVEVVFGCAFRPVLRLTTAHLGMWWEQIGREHYPRCEEQPPLGMVVEHLPGRPSPPIDVSLSVSPRLWFISGREDQLIQVQRDRLLCNWRKLSDSDDYPRYHTLSDVFFERLQEFSAFVKSETDAALVHTQYELTYINHIVLGAGEELVHMGHVFPDLSWREGSRFLPPPTGAEARVSFDIPGGDARLHVKANTGRAKQGGARIIMMELTMRGIGTPIGDWFEQAHQWIVRGFTDLTSKACHDHWRRVT